MNILLFCLAKRFQVSVSVYSNFVNTKFHQYSYSICSLNVREPQCAIRLLCDLIGSPLFSHSARRECSEKCRLTPQYLLSHLFLLWRDNLMKHSKWVSYCNLDQLVLITRTLIKDEPSQAVITLNHQLSALEDHLTNPASVSIPGFFTNCHLKSKFFSLCASNSIRMSGFMVRFGVAVLFISMVLMVCYPVDAYRKPPFNGSIFGKRAGKYYAT